MNRIRSTWNGSQLHDDPDQRVLIARDSGRIVGTVRQDALRLLDRMTFEVFEAIALRVETCRMASGDVSWMRLLPGPGWWARNRKCVPATRMHGRSIVDLATESPVSQS